MIDVVDTRIKAFGKTPKAGFVSPSEQLITLTIGQLQDIITQAVEKAIQPLQDEVESLKATSLYPPGWEDSRPGVHARDSSR